LAVSIGSVAPDQADQRFAYGAWVVKAARVDGLPLSVVGYLKGKIGAHSLNMTCAPSTASAPKPDVLADDVLL
jgi:hypothetical protein